MEARILYAENEIVGVITKKRLEESGYEVHLAQDGAAAWNLFRKMKFDLCLLDVMMPELNGFELAQRIREVDEKVPILFVTSKAMEADKLYGFRTGADDYVTKPFSVPELLLRINVFLKHRERAAIASKPIYTFGAYVLDMERLVLSKDGVNVDLTMSEVKILLALAKNMKNIISREQLIYEVWCKEDNHFTGRSLDVHMHRIRKRLKDDPRVEIETIRNEGYRLQVFDGI